MQILGLQGVDPSKFAAFNVLEDGGLRSGEFSISLYLRILRGLLLREGGMGLIDEWGDGRGREERERERMLIKN